MAVYEIKTKLVGVSFTNDDKSYRQELIKNLLCDEVLSIEHEPSNPYDSNSHIIKNSRGQILGHLSRELAADVLARKVAGHVLVGIKEYVVTGGVDKQSYGVNIVIKMEKPDG